MLKSPKTQVQQEATCVVVNLSVLPENEGVLAVPAVLEPLIRLLQIGDPSVQEQAVWALGNVSANATSKVAIIHLGALGALRALNEHRSSPELQAWICPCLFKAPVRGQRIVCCSQSLFCPGGRHGVCRSRRWRRAKHCTRCAKFSPRFRVVCTAFVSTQVRTHPLTRSRVVPLLRVDREFHIFMRHSHGGNLRSTICVYCSKTYRTQGWARTVQLKQRTH